MQLLVEFVEAHPGLRVGSLFGDPAIAGSRVCARLTSGGLECRLPYDQVPNRAARRLAQRTAHNNWVVVMSMPVGGHRALVQLLEYSISHTTASMR